MPPRCRLHLAVAASTLAVFFLFQPLRRRVQRLVDRRFNRSRYDAEQVATTLSASLRDVVDPNAVTARWVSAVDLTMQPSSMSLWVKTE